MHLHDAQLLGRCISRSVEMLSHSSERGSLEVEVLTHAGRCLAVAGGSAACRQALCAIDGLARDLCRGLYYGHLPELGLSLVRCVGALAAEGALQGSLLGAGALFHLLLTAFQYDYTLREGGVEASIETNQQARTLLFGPNGTFDCNSWSHRLASDI